MKRSLIIFNIIILAAVSYLYYLHFASCKVGKQPVSVQRASSGGSSDDKSLIAYIDMDSMNEKINYIKKIRKDLDAEQKNIETEWENGYKSLEKQKNDFLKRGASITNEMAQEFQGKLMQQQDVVDSRKQELTQKLSEKHYRLMDDVQKKLKEYLNDYNKENNYSYILMVGTGLDYMVYKDSALNITDDIIEGMNKKLNADKN